MNPRVQRVQNMYDKGGAGIQKCLVMATFNQFPAIGKGLIKSRPQSGIFDSLHPFCHTNSELSGHKIHQDPCTWGKNAPRNAWKQILFKFWAIMGHSVPFQTEEGSTGDEDFDRWVEFLRTFSRARLCCFCTLYNDINVDIS